MLETSRYLLTDDIIFDACVTKSSWRKPSILKRELSKDDYFTFTVTNDLECRPDKISQAVYQTPHLDWLLIAYNRVAEPFGWPGTGLIIKVPRPELFMPELLV